MDFSSRAEHVLESVFSLVLPAELASTGAQCLFDFRIKSPPYFKCLLVPDNAEAIDGGLSGTGLSLLWRVRR